MSGNNCSTFTPHTKPPCVHWSVRPLLRPWKRLERQLSVMRASHREDSPEATRVHRADQGFVHPSSYFGLARFLLHHAGAEESGALSGDISLILGSPVLIFPGESLCRVWGVWGGLLLICFSFCHLSLNFMKSLWLAVQGGGCASLAFCPSPEGDIAHSGPGLPLA